MSSLRRFLTLIGLAFTGLALASPASAAEESLPVRLLAPQAGATLLAGSAAELEWDGPELPARIKEWEAFLSFDGGKTYPVRITPHLDRDLRRVRWQVPGVPTADARLLLRFGDERRESYHRLPQRFSIASAQGAEGAFALASVATAAGEPALPGHPGVIAWMEGSRRGGSLRQMVAPQRPWLRSTLSPPESKSEAAILEAEEARVQPPAQARPSAGGIAPSCGGGSLREGAPTPRLSSDILLLTQRQNE